MSVKVAVIVYVDNGGAGRYELAADVSVPGDNPRYTAMSTERALRQCGEELLRRIVAMDGDIRDDDREQREDERLVTTPS